MTSTESPRGEIPPPRCKAILLCDNTIIEAGTGKISMLGVFDGFELDEIPGVTPSCTAFVELADGIGSHSVVVEVHDLTDGVVIAEGTLAERISWSERPAKRHLIIPLPPLRVNHAGAYDLVIFAGHQEIDRQRFFVLSTPPSAGEQSPEEFSHE